MLQGKEMVEIRSDKPFQMRMEHMMDRLESPQIIRLHDGHMNSESSAGKGETFYQGTRMLFGWDTEMAADSSATFSLSLHF